MHDVRLPSVITKNVHTFHNRHEDTDEDHLFPATKLQNQEQYFLKEKQNTPV